MEIEIDTPKGPGRAEVEWPDGDARYLLAITHGAGGGVDAPDILAVRDAVLASGGAVARVTQPYRVAGRRMPGAATGPQDLAWSAMIEKLRAEPGAAGVPLVLGGRSNGARVACRTASALGADAVVALAFPLHPPGKPEKSRAGELRGAGVPVLVVNGDRDPFGVPDAADARTLEVRRGERHELSKDPEGVGTVVAEWLGERFPAR
ncbi:alpha/beta hydrolase [Nocardiopsis sp. RSe5-2]|uniref:Alpha/beta hydrolase n=1 Tax=Nocardiopsis endophytica TaxID=3018445 RepID=A0ABT4U7J1_9ACTN|nr:alpha/beta family hydrolase [Nocardiopsis endophytica]MDA2812920.1 alpha/beta hydrolase [Nocardiopsis endophytica]